ncbi:MAG: class I SAM-dependent methyltransferase [bacterium]
MQNSKIEEEMFNEKGTNGDYDFFPENDYLKMWNISGFSKNDKKKTIFEAGCGTGAFGRRLATMGYSVTGGDIAGKLVQIANKMAKKEGSTYRAVKVDLLNMKKFKKKFDYILCPAVLHHFPELEPVMKSMSLILKPKGTLVLVEPNGSQPVVKLSEFIRKNIWPFNTMKNLATPNETMHTVKSYKKVLENNGYEIIKIGTFEPHMIKGDYGFFVNILLFIKYDILQKMLSLILGGYNSGSVLVMKAVKK